jgi:hypothetical protein
MTVRAPLRLATVAIAALALASLVPPGCSSESDVSSTCKPNVTKDGIADVKDGCDQFAVCVIDGHRVDPTACCAGLTDGELADCLYGYGVGAPVGTGGGTPTPTTPPTTKGAGGGGGTAGGGGSAGGGGGP